jgi:transketolase
MTTATLIPRAAGRPALSPREQFARTSADLVDADPRVALVYAEISGQYLGEVTRRHPDRVINVGIREQLLVSAGAGLALSGLTPIVHTFGSFLVERPFEQIKLDFVHQGVPGVLVGSGGSFDVAAGGRTHQSPGDVALLATLPGIDVHVPGSAAEVDAAIRASVAAGGLHYVRVVDQTNHTDHPHRPGRFHTVRREPGAPVVVAVGPQLDAVLEATAHRPVTVLYANTVRPFDRAGLAAVADSGEVVLVEPYLAGTSAYEVSEALQAVPHRLLSLGVRRLELRRYGSPAEHVAAHGLDAAGIRAAVDRFLA